MYRVLKWNLKLRIQADRGLYICGILNSCNQVLDILMIFRNYTSEGGAWTRTLKFYTDLVLKWLPGGVTELLIRILKILMQSMFYSPIISVTS